MGACLQVAAACVPRRSNILVPQCCHSYRRVYQPFTRSAPSIRGYVQMPCRVLNMPLDYAASRGNVVVSGVMDGPKEASSFGSVLQCWVDEVARLAPSSAARGVHRVGVDFIFPLPLGLL